MSAALDIEIVKGYPPNYKEIVAALPAVEFNHNVVFTYGDKVYTPYADQMLPYDLRVHESVHVHQQRELGVEEWWDLYLKSDTFRFVQEIQAYHAQYMALSKHQRNLRLRQLAGDLCGPLYGNLADYKTAKALVRGDRVGNS